MPQPSLSTYHPSLGERLQSGFANLLGKVGVDPRYASHVSQRALGFLNDLTPVGNATMAADAGTAIRNGHPFKGLGLGALAVLPGAAGKTVGKVARKAGGMFGGGIRAWHGSPHDFDKFSLSKIGTGEGAQAYGHGLYFAETPEVAKAYQGKLSGARVRLGDQPFDVEWAQRSQMSDPAQIAAEAFHRFGGDAETAIKWLRDANATRLDKEAAKVLAAHHRKGAIAMEQNPGRLYEVNINAKPEDFLDWDAPIVKQPQAIQQLAKEIDGSGRFGRPLSSFNPFGHDLARRASVAPNGIRTGDYQREALLRAGVPGIQYFDQGSRTAGQGSRNYVVFDDSLVDILNKF